MPASPAPNLSKVVTPLDDFSAPGRIDGRKGCWFYDPCVAADSSNPFGAIYNKAAELACDYGDELIDYVLQPVASVSSAVVCANPAANAATAGAAGSACAGVFYRLIDSHQAEAGARDALLDALAPDAIVRDAAIGAALGTLFERASIWLLTRGAGGPNQSLGSLISVNVDDPAADALARRIGGRASVKFELDPTGREFDVVSDLYIAQTKPANFQLGSKFRYQAQATFEIAQRTGRQPYFHFDGPPSDDVLRRLAEYSQRYGIPYVVDLVPL